MARATSRVPVSLPPALLVSFSWLIPCIAVCLALCGASAAHAERADREKSIEFQGDTGGGNAESKTGELVGHVIITQGTMMIQADRVTFRQNQDNSLSATAYGNPVRFREKRDKADDYYEGYAQRIVYDGEKRFVELFENALLKKTGDEIRSNYISYNAATEQFSAEGRPDAKPPAAGDSPLGARVRGTFQPKGEDKAEKPAAKDKDSAPASKDKGDAAKDKGDPAKPVPPLTLKPSGD
jgi:lipopolysaccharide export system protein LptA